ncbi:triacylglycerol lipase OBL1-like [Diospyros lotus]|uniref:triacylglycerol lipase OBL1-like n=1 Tax=Diospyros lotus TaxID=55363 RepID=UPI00225B3492|nr:triacylglycerol lipase OBL1-like [Diospyros lotus]
MASNQSISKNYMLLSPEKATLVDLIRLLVYRDIEKRPFIECPDERREESFLYRWLIFVSVLLQMFLYSVAKPLEQVGSAVETLLNLQSTNSNFLTVLLDFFQGKKVKRDEDSFLSVVGHADPRKQLDKDIKPGDIRYHAALSMMASKASYENKAYIQTTVKDQWKMEFLGFFDFWNVYQEKNTTQAFMLRDQDLIVVAFRGTEPFDAYAWSTDIDLSWYELSIGKVHSGFMKALGLQKDPADWPRELPADPRDKPVAYYDLRERLRKMIKANDRAKFIVTGHSLGGALAILFPTILAIHGEDLLLKRLRGVYTFGQPRVGDKSLGEFVEGEFRKYDIPYYRFVYSNDVVPRVPFEGGTLMFKHFGTCLYYNSFYQGMMKKEEPNKNYFSLLELLPKILNAVWELIRSFIIPYIKGQEYKESGFLKLIRLVGLVFPGGAAHSPQDYVNASRLGSPTVYPKI